MLHRSYGEMVVGKEPGELELWQILQSTTAIKQHDYLGLRPE